MFDMDQARQYEDDGGGKWEPIPDGTYDLTILKAGWQEPKYDKAPFLEIQVGTRVNGRKMKSIVRLYHSKASGEPIPFPEEADHRPGRCVQRPDQQQPAGPGRDGGQHRPRHPRDREERRRVREERADRCRGEGRSPAGARPGAPHPRGALPAPAGASGRRQPGRVRPPAAAGRLRRRHPVRLGRLLPYEEPALAAGLGGCRCPLVIRIAFALGARHGRAGGPARA